MRRIVIATISLCVCAIPVLAQAKAKETVKLTTAKVDTFDIIYKKAPQGELTLHGYRPTDWKETDKRPVIVFFFGGGWKSGAFTQFVPQAEYFASRGIVAISADYRIQSKHKTTPQDAVEDAKSAIRYVRANAAKLGIDPDKIIASGGSAGGHLAACTALIEGQNAKDDPKVSSVPNAMVLFNPVLNLLSFDRTTPGSKEHDAAKSISPTFSLNKSTPPAIIFFGTADKMIEQGHEYLGKAKELGVRTELLSATDMPHGFFNRSPWIETTTVEADKFLQSLGYLKGEPTVNTTEAKLNKVEVKK